MKNMRSRLQLIKLYLECDSMHEFLIKKDLEVPEASKLDVLACKIYDFKCHHKNLWHSIWFSSFLAFVICGFVVGCFLSMPDLKNPAWFVSAAIGLCLWEIAAIVYLELFYDFMQCLDLHIKVPINFKHENQ